MVLKDHKKTGNFDLTQLDGDCVIRYFPSFLSSSEAGALFGFLKDRCPWEQPEILYFGRRIAVPRLVAWFAPPGVRYGYSGLRHEPVSIPGELKKILKSVCRATCLPFNGILANYYRHGMDSMGWHRDNEPELGPRPQLAFLTLGARRRFCVKSHGAPSPKWVFRPEHGSLLLMEGACQERFEHCLPKTRQQQGERINLSFRMILQPKEGGKLR